MQTNIEIEQIHTKFMDTHKKLQLNTEIQTYNSEIAMHIHIQNTHKHCTQTHTHNHTHICTHIYPHKHTQTYTHTNKYTHNKLTNSFIHKTLL